MKTTRALLLLPFLPAALLGAAAEEEKRFEPARSFPFECLFYLQVPSGKELARALSETLPGRLALDPDVRRALGNLPRLIRQMIHVTFQDFLEATGRDPIEILELLEGEITLDVAGLDPGAAVKVMAALELGARREEILAVLQKVSAFLPRQGGSASTVEIGKRRAALWRKPGAPPVHFLVLGTHLVLSTSADALRGAAEAFDGAPGSANFTLTANARWAESAAGLQLERPRLFLFANLEALRGLLMTFAGRNPDAKEAVKVLQASGLASITSFGYALGSRGGDVEGKVFLGTGGGPRGLLKDLLASLGRPGDLSGALALAPAGATAIGGVSIDGGMAFRALDRFLREGLPPQLAANAAEFLRKIEEKGGISRERDLFTLGKIDALLVSSDPPAGGSIPDCLVLARTTAIEPYRAVLLKTARALGKEVQVLPGPAAPGVQSPPQISYLRIGSVFTRLAGIPDRPRPQGFAQALLQPPISVASCDLEGGWTVAAPSPQALWRYLSQPRGAPASLAGHWKEFEEAEGFLILKPSLTLLAAYNTLGTLAGPVGDFFNARHDLKAGGDRAEDSKLELDLALLPPGEKFLGALGEGFVRIDAGPEGLTLHGHRLVSSGGMLLILLLAAAAGARAFVAG
jgi:hypothetical protein